MAEGKPPGDEVGAATESGSPAIAARPSLRSVGEYGRLANAWVSVLLKRQIARSRRQGLLPAPAITTNDPFAGAYISDNEIENASYSLLDEGLRSGSLPQDEEGIVTSNVEKLTQALRLALAESRRQGVALPILTLIDRFRLSQDETELLVALAAIASDARLRRIVAYLQNDFSRRRPDAGVVLSMLSDNTGSTDLAWQLLAPQSTLRMFNLVMVQGGDRDRATWLLDRPLAVADAIAAFIYRGTHWLDESIVEFTQLVDPVLPWESLHWPAALSQELRQRFALLATQVEQGGQSAGLLLRGSSGTGKKTAALAFCHERQRRLLVVDCRRLPAGEDLAFFALRTLGRESRTLGAYLYFEHCDALKGDAPSSAGRLHALVAMYHHLAELVLFSTELEARADLEGLLFLAATELQPLPADSRTMLWRKFLPPQIDPSGVKARYLGDQFPVAPSTILQVGADLKALAEVAPVNPTQQVLARMVLDRSRHNLSASAAKVTGRQKWEDIVLPSDILNRCLRIAQFVKYQRVLSDSWGFGRKLLTHSGVSALFSGPPGVGKTMMAGIIGRELGLDVYRIDLSRILSKWVGETEKNLSALFDEANRTRAVLVFDEADALFSKRTDVNSSSDRYSNVEVNYLLQKMEVFDGIIILTTNLEKGIDEAFVRRLDFRIRFPEPTLEERQEMWERMLPTELQYGRDVDLAELARNFEMTGGYIKKALIRAGLIAIERSAEQRILFQEDLRRAISEEMQEAGRLAYDIDE